jgi:hypothetical protein
MERTAIGKIWAEHYPSRLTHPPSPQIFVLICCLVSELARTDSSDGNYTARVVRALVATGIPAHEFAVCEAEAKQL